MKCPSCGYENPPEGRQDNVCDECGSLFHSDDAVKRNIINASGDRRFVNYVGDHIIFRFVLTPLILLFSHTEFIQTLAKNPIQDWVFSIGLLFLYYFMFEAFCQRSPAKFITRTKVVTEDGSKPTITQIFYRTLWRFMPLEPLSFSNGRCWHDRFPRVRVVEDR